MAIDTVIFDFDGTIANTNQVIINSWQHTYMARNGAPGDEEEIVKSFGEPLAVTMAKVFPDFDVDESIKIYRGYQVQHFSDMIEIFPGVKESMEKLKKEGYRIAVVTSRMRNTTCEGMEAFGIEHLVDTLVSCEDTDKHKPDPEPVLKALEKLEIEPEEAVMVGDSMFDIRCAHNAGVKAALVSWAVAVSDEERNGPEGPEYYLEEADDILDIVKKA